MRARAACGVATPHQIAIGLQKLVCGLRLAGILIRPPHGQTANGYRELQKQSLLAPESVAIGPSEYCAERHFYGYS